MKPTSSNRPHPNPCACQECQDWAKAIVGEIRPRKPPGLPTQGAPEMPLADFASAMIAAACKATGMNEFELRAKAAEIGHEYPEPPTQVERDTVAARGVPEIHIRAVYDEPPVECEALMAVREFVKGKKTTLILAGGVGLRKTGSACWALTQKPGVFVTADEALRLSTSRIVEDIEAWRRARNAQVLVVDDMGGEYSDDKGWSVKVFNGLLDHRYSSGLKTIATTNLQRERFAADYGERITDRIRETGRWLTLGGQSVRRA